MKNSGVLIGILLGMAAVSLVFYFINKTAYKGNDVTKAVSQYIDGSEQLKVTIPDRKTGLFDFNFKSYKKSLYADKNGDVTQVLFYSEEYKKYFNLLLYDDSMTNDRQIVMYITNQQVNITVNKDDFNNSKYGSKESPIPAFKFDVISPKIDNPVLHTTQDSYVHNVTQYLQFVMPKDEFNQRFGKN